MASATMLYMGTRQGLFVASRPGTSREWHLTRHTLDGRPVAQLVVGSTLPARLLAAVPGVGLFHSANGGREWMLTLPLAVSALLADPLDPECIYAGLDQRPDSGSHPSTPGVPAASMVMMSQDGGLSWRPGGEMPATPTRVRSLALSEGLRAIDNRTLWAGLESGGVLYSTDSGEHWQGMLLGLDPREPVRELAGIGPTATDLFAATRRGLYRLAQGQRASDASWKGSNFAWRLIGVKALQDVKHLLVLGRMNPPTRMPPALLAVDRPGQFLRSEDGGVIWSALTFPVPSGESATNADISALAPHPEYPDRGYAATHGGRIYETRTRGTAWDDTGLQPDGSVFSLAVVVLK
jgi:hypothetical protein